MKTLKCRWVPTGEVTLDLGFQNIPPRMIDIIEFIINADDHQEHPLPIEMGKCGLRHIEFSSAVNPDAYGEYDPSTGTMRLDVEGCAAGAARYIIQKADSQVYYGFQMYVGLLEAVAHELFHSFWEPDLSDPEGDLIKEEKAAQKWAYGQLTALFLAYEMEMPLSTLTMLSNKVKKYLLNDKDGYGKTVVSKQGDWENRNIVIQAYNKNYKSYRHFLNKERWLGLGPGTTIEEAMYWISPPTPEVEPTVVVVPPPPTAVLVPPPPPQITVPPPPQAVQAVTSNKPGVIIDDEDAILMQAMLVESGTVVEEPMSYSTPQVPVPMPVYQADDKKELDVPQLKQLMCDVAITLFSTMVEKCEFNDQGYPQNPNGILEWVDISHIENVTCGAISKVCTVDPHGVNTVVPFNGMVKGLVSSKQKLPHFVLTFVWKGREYRRMFMAQNPDKLVPSGEKPSHLAALSKQLHAKVMTVYDPDITKAQVDAAKAIGKPLKKWVGQVVDYRYMEYNKK